MATSQLTDLQSTSLSTNSLTSRQEAPELETNTSDEVLSQLSDQSSDTVGEEDGDVLYRDRDDAELFMQPAISPVATRHSYARTPGTQRAAVMEGLSIGEHIDGTIDQEPNILQPTSEATKQPLEAREPDSLGPLPRRDQTQPSPLPTPWRTGPKEFVIDRAKHNKSPKAGVFIGSGKGDRVSSIGEQARKRFSKAFPSMNLPSNFLSNLTTPSFLSSAWDQNPTPTRRLQSRAGMQRSATVYKVTPGPRPQRSSSGTSRNSSTLRRTNSEDSALYHSLSRVSSFGDDDRWTDIREQVNVRFKAIKDSWDAPTFKLPNILPESLKTARLGLNDSTQAISPRALTPASTQRARGDGSAHSPLDSVLETLTGDIVILGGYRGSVLRSTKPPHRQLWVPVKVGLNIRKVNMEVGLDPEDEENMEKHIFASGMLQHIGPVDISKRLFKKLRDCDNAKKGLLRVHDFGYDWRLSPHLLSRKIVQFLEKLPSNQPGVPVEKRGALVIAHSLGGMLTRHAVNQRPELFSGVLYAGVPQRCINILGPLRNGDAVLLNEKVLTARVNFSLRTTFVFLPEDGFCFIDKHTGESYPVDFYNVDHWIKYRLSPCVSDPALPPLLLKGSTSFGRPLRSLSGSFPTLPLRGRSNSDGKKHHSPTRHTVQETVRKAEITKDRTLAPQMLSSGSPNDTQQQLSSTPATPSDRARNIAYLRRTLAQTKAFRAELAHNPAHQAANIYPPVAVLYGKEIPTVYAARVNAGGIPHADAYDDLVFHSGDGVVLAREAMPPAGYEIVRGGRVSTDRGHITMLGDLSAVGRALEAVVRGRRKGIGMGVKEDK